MNRSAVIIKEDGTAREGAVFGAWCLLWLPPMWAASHAWRHGEYYDYGWFVPPAALWLALAAMRRGEIAPLRRPGLGFAAAVLAAWLLALLPLRVLGLVDPGWRLPMIGLGALAVVISHGYLWWSGGLRLSARLVWPTLLLVSALPWPSRVEAMLVHSLTARVVEAVGELFLLQGVPVVVMGDLLVLHETTVEVTDGCSGVRSFQSFVMATWFFAGLMRLSWGRALVLLVAACVAAFVLNTGRAYALAAVSFNHGEEAFDKVHDWLGIAAFVAAAVFFYLLSGWLADGAKKRMLVRRRASIP